MAPESLRTAASDLNGQMRGKRLPARYLETLQADGHRMPLSALSVDLWGRDTDGSPLTFATGDADGVLRMTDRGPVPMPWLARPAKLIPMATWVDEGRPFAGDPRHALAGVIARFAARGWHVIAATELEFTLIDDRADPITPARDPATGRPMHIAGINAIDQIDAVAAFFDDVYDGAAAMGIALQSTVSEAGTGQFELTLDHGPAMRVADDTWLLKALVRGMARRHGMAATFVAKPFADAPGNGLHLHFSVLDRSGANVFDNGLATGATVMHQAVAGCLAAMPASTLVFAPHADSYARFTDHSHAPTRVAWGYENRTTALRIPGGAPEARRIEHRVAGADTNPYLVLTAILGAAMNGIDDAATPPPATDGDAYASAAATIPTDWATAIAKLDAVPMRRVLPPLLIEMLTRVKRQEAATSAGMPATRRFRETHQAV